MTRSTIKIDEAYRDKLEVLSEKWSLSMKDYLQRMIDYFEETDLDPTSKKIKIQEEIAAMRKEILSAIKESRNTYISFIREQEKTKLNPLIKQINDNTEALLKHIDREYFPKINLDPLLQNDTALSTESNGTTPNAEIPSSSGRNVAVSDYEWMLARARELFENFVKNGKRSTFGSGLVFDSDTVQWYQIEFAKLIF